MKADETTQAIAKNFALARTTIDQPLWTFPMHLRLLVNMEIKFRGMLIPSTLHASNLLTSHSPPLPLLLHHNAPLPHRQPALTFVSNRPTPPLPRQPNHNAPPSPDSHNQSHDLQTLLPVPTRMPRSPRRRRLHGRAVPTRVQHLEAVSRHGGKHDVGGHDERVGE